MIRLILPVTICLAGPLSAQKDLACGPDADPRHCQEILMCIGSDGRWFSGAARGMGPVNDVMGTMDNGVECSGQRMHFNMPWSGSITLNCKDGTNAAIDYTQPSLGDRRNFGTGSGTTEDGHALSVWVGDDLVKVLRQESGGIVSLLPCPGGAIRLD